MNRCAAFLFVPPTPGTQVGSRFTAELQRSHRRVDLPRRRAATIHKCAAEPEEATAFSPVSLESLPATMLPRDPAADFPAEWENAPGVYAVLNAQLEVQYIELSRAIASSLAWHISHLPADECAFAKVVPWSVEMFDGQVSPRQMNETAMKWINDVVEETGSPPVGNDGRVKNSLWRDRPTAKKSKPNITFESDSALESTREQIQRIIDNHEVVLFMKGSRAQPQCGFSARSVELLQGIAGDERLECIDCLDEDLNPGLREGIKEFSEWPTIPQVYVKGEFIGGADIAHEMAASGDLQSLLE